MSDKLSRRRQESSVHLSFDTLEPRQLLSVSVSPHQMSHRTVAHGHGRATVRILSDASVDATTIDVPSLKVIATPDGRHLKLDSTVEVGDVNRDGHTDLIVRFRRSELAGLLGSAHAVDVVIDVQGTRTVHGLTSNVIDFGHDTLSIVAGRGRHGHAAS